MNILYIHDYPLKEGGGIEVQTYMDARSLVARGHKVTIASTRITSETYSAEKIPTDDMVRFFQVSTKEVLIALIGAADIVSIQATFSLRPGMMDALEILHDMNKKYIVSLRTTYNHIPFSNLMAFSEKEQKEKLERFAKYLQNDNCFIQTVSGCFDATLAFLGVDKKTHTIYNAKNWESFLVPAVESVSPVDITYIGEISWMKGLHILLGAIPNLQAQYPDIKIRIIGGGQDTAHMRAILATLPTKNIEVLPYIENKNLASFMRATKILAVPSLTESWCNVAMEALGCGICVVGANIEGLVELLENGDRGILFEAGDTVDFTNKILYALEVEHINHSVYVQEKYALDKKILALESFYNMILYIK